MSPTHRRSALLAPLLGLLAAGAAAASAPQPDLETLAASLRTSLEGYAAPKAGPRDLAPHLTGLLALEEEAAARAIWEACRTATEFLEELDENQAFLRKRNAKLSRKKEEGLRKSESKLEQHRRLIELSAKKIKIQAGQRERLASMQQALLKALECLSGREATTFLVGQLKTVRSSDLRAAILRVLIADKAVHTVPLLIKRLGTTDRKLRQKLLTTLRKITGVDVGEWKRDWSKWWAKNKDRAKQEPVKEAAK